jgi:hypothetical protein
MYVSRGVGMSMLPIRFDCRPEVTILTIHPETELNDRRSAALIAEAER